MVTRLPFLFQRPGNRVDAGNAITPAHAHYIAIMFDFHSVTQRAHDSGQRCSDRQRSQFLGRAPDVHINKGNRAFFTIPVGNCQRDALAILFYAQNDELAGPDRPGDFRRQKGDLVQVGDEHFVFEDLKHVLSVFIHLIRVQYFFS